MEYRVKRYELSYGIPNESLEDRIIRLEELEPSKYTDIIGDSDKAANRFPLYHGLGFRPLDKLESILIHKYIYPGKKIPTEFESMDGTIHYLGEYYGSNEWYTDIKNFDNGIYGNINAGVLSEDGIWNTLEEYKELKDLFK